MPENTSKHSSDKFISFCSDLIAMGVVGFILGLPVMFLWNSQISSMFNLNNITYIQGVALVFFVNLLSPVRFDRRMRKEG